MSIVYAYFKVLQLRCEAAGQSVLISRRLTVRKGKYIIYDLIEVLKLIKDYRSFY